MGIDIEDFLDFCEKIEVKDNDLLVFKVARGVPQIFVEQTAEAMLNIIKERITKKICIIILGIEVESIVQIPEEEMNKLGYFKRDETAKEAT